MKCKHEITSVTIGRLAGFNAGMRILCVGCGLATSFLSTFRGAKTAWKQDRRKIYDGSKELAAAIRGYENDFTEEPQ